MTEERVLNFEIICLVCRAVVPPDEDGTFHTVHPACLACPICQGVMMVNYSTNENPATTWCRACAWREEEAKRAAESALEQERLSVAEALLLAGGGTREDREAALEVVAEYNFTQGCS